MKASYGLVAGAFLLAVVGSSYAQHSYIGAEKCKMCHKVQYDSWLTTRHAKATETAKASTKWKFDASCLSCHATNKDEALSGVQCEACHGPGRAHVELMEAWARDPARRARLGGSGNRPAEPRGGGCAVGSEARRGTNEEPGVRSEAVLDG